LVVKINDKIKVIAVPNRFFGEKVTVSGLVTGSDILFALKGKVPKDAKILIPQNMLRAGEDIFLDGMKLFELEDSLGVKIKVVPVNGAEFAKVLLHG